MRCRVVSSGGCALSSRIALERYERGSSRTSRAAIRGLPRVHAAAAEIGAWMRLLPNDAYREHRLGLAASRLPSVVFWHRQGLSAEVIGQRLTPFGERCYGDRAIDAACGVIAALLNDGPNARAHL